MSNYTPTRSKSISALQIYEAEIQLARSCEVMARLIGEYGGCPLGVSRPPFQCLVTSIISQQLSKKAAHAIEGRVKLVAPGLTPEEFLAASPENLRRAGLSSSKIRYILELASRVDDGGLDLRSLQAKSDEGVISKLIELPGVGKWTAEMFLIFGLGRLDVLSLGDAGLQRASRLLFGESAQLHDIGQTWRPFRSVASWYLWRTLD